MNLEPIPKRSNFFAFPLLLDNNVGAAADARLGFIRRRDGDFSRIAWVTTMRYKLKKEKLRGNMTPLEFVLNMLTQATKHSGIKSGGGCRSIRPPFCLRPK